MTAQSGSDEDLLRDLAQRLLTHPHPEGRTSVELFLRRFPKSLPLELPLPSASMLLGGAPLAPAATHSDGGGIRRGARA